VLPIIWVLLEQRYALALYIFVFAGVSDAIDGLLARLYGWTSRFGAMLDPLADKFLLTASFITLGYLGHFSFWLVTLVVARDVWIIFGGLLYRYVMGYIEFEPSLISKMNTFLQILLVSLMLINLSFYPMPVIVLKIIVMAVLMSSIASMAHYTLAWSFRAMRGEKKILETAHRSAA
jgi:cardiolipin synthase